MVSSSSSSVPTTTGEILFQDYLETMEYPYVFEKEFPGKSKRPDYTVERGGTFLFDVKDFDENAPLGFSAYDPLILASERKSRKGARSLGSSRNSLALWS
jgi:hypothetical protein